MRSWIDIPPIWLLAALCLGYVQDRFWPLGLRLGPVTEFLGGLTVGAGLLLIALAAYEMRAKRTTIIPHREAAALVTTGIFSRSRNPIYLGDALILTGCLLYWDAIPSLALIPLFVWIIERRFILREEDALRRKFRADFARYTQNTRRWV